MMVKGTLAYNKDMQEDKERFDAADTARVPQGDGRDDETARFNRDRLAACRATLHGTDLADYLVRRAPCDAIGVSRRIVMACLEQGRALEGSP